MPGNPHPDRKGLQADWEALIGMPPPAFLSVRVIEKALAYEAQCKAHGGLSAQTRRSLARFGSGRDSSSGPVPPTNLKPGAHLVREWNGRTYQVEVLEQGFRMDGRTWTSLSALARHITGTNWSGPRFFGMTNAGAARP